ncbi:MAG TPA: hypothetical protein VL119_10950 [Acidimicrobiia bacterium]|nr:hypothetical protein [Acidimicrobiia bacterium]
MTRLFLVACLVFAGACSSGGHSATATVTTTTPSSTDAVSPSGKIRGTLRIVGGPAPGIDRSIPGTVTAVARSGRQWQATSTAASGFSLDLPLGSYRVSGTSPNVNGGRSPCVVPALVVVKSDTTTNVQVVCDVP